MRCQLVVAEGRFGVEAPCLVRRERQVGVLRGIYVRFEAGYRHTAVKCDTDTAPWRRSYKFRSGQGKGTESRGVTR